MVDSRAVETAPRVRNRRSIGARVKHHDISTRNVSCTAMNTPVATESGRSHHGDAREQERTSSHNGCESTRQRFTNPVSMDSPNLYPSIYPKIYLSIHCYSCRLGAIFTSPEKRDENDTTMGRPSVCPRSLGQ